MPSLDSAYAQLDRASEHFVELKRLHDEVCTIQAKTTVLNLKTEATVPAGQQLEIGEIRSPQPPVAIRIRIIAGETANALRSALDYLVGQLSMLDTKTDVMPERTQFPIADSPKSFKDAKRRGFLDGVSGPHVAKIQELQPYNGGHWLILLAMLTNFAKHDDLILLKHGVLLATHKFPVDPTDPNPFKHNMRVDFQNVIQIAINEGFALLPTLEILKSEVSKVLDSFKPEFT
jgi:hypothetical protein